MNAEIISIGDELLIGQRLNTNAPFIASEMAAAGIGVGRIIVCSDQETSIEDQLAESLERSDIVLVTGGLGPTRDDRTKQAVGSLLSRNLVFDEGVYAQTVERYRNYRREPAPYLRENAMILEGARVIRNETGLAPGMIIRCDEAYPDRWLVLMPGVPREMEEMIRNGVIPFFSEISGGVIVHAHIRTTGTGETVLSELIRPIEDVLPEGTSLAYLPHTAGVALRVSTSGSDRETVEEQNRAIADAIREKVGEFIYANEDITLEESVGKMLADRSLTIACAESCTGGLVASRLTDVSGSSRYFLQGFVVYSNASKEKALGVRSSTLVAHGAVSEEVAGEMAEGCLAATGADITVSSTGIAGPLGGLETKPVGTVCLGVAFRGENGMVECRTETVHVRGDRLRNKIRFSEAALRMVWKTLRDLPV